MAGDRSARVRRALLLAAATVALAACDAPTVGAPDAPYDPTNGTGGISYRWDFGRRVAVFADTVGESGDTLDIRAAVTRAAALWNAVPEFEDFTLARVDDVRDADVIVHYWAAPRRVDVFDCAPGGGGAGRTVFCPDTPRARVLPFLDGSGGHVKVDVYVDPARFTAAQLAAARMTRDQLLGALVAHELGHVVGIGGHSDRSTDLMWTGLLVVDAPTARDQATLRAALRVVPDIRL